MPRNRKRRRSTQRSKSVPAIVLVMYGPCADPLCCPPGEPVQGKPALWSVPK